MSEPGNPDPDQAQAIEGQALLFSRELELANTKRRNAGRYTAEELKAERPGVYDRLVELLGKGWGLLKLAHDFGVHHRTVAAVRDQMATTVEQQRKQAVSNLRLAGHLQVDRLVDHPESVPIQFAAPAAKQLLELAEVMDGGVSSRTEHVERVDIFSDWSEFVQTLRSEKELGADQVTELPPAAGIGLRGEKKIPLGLPDGTQVDLGTAGSELAPGERRTDRESDDPPREATTDLTTNLPTSQGDQASPATPNQDQPERSPRPPDPGPGAPPDGGGGGPTRPRPASDRTHPS